MPRKCTRVTVTCQRCQVRFDCFPSQVRIFCSRACRFAVNPEDRFWSKVDTSGGVHACWPWTGARNERGYGQFQLDGRKEAAHRLAYMFRHGAIPAGKLICHRCNIPPCVNPTHLYAGSLSDNMQDALRAGAVVMGDDHWTRRQPERVGRGADSWAHRNRHRMIRGEQCHTNKLTPEQVIAIRHRFAEGGVKYAHLAREYGVTGVNIAAIIKRETWKHLLDAT